MFTSAELANRLVTMTTLARPKLLVAHYDAQAFDVPTSEESIALHRGRKTDMSDAIVFWLGSVTTYRSVTTSRIGTYVRRHRCAPLDQTAFDAIVARCTERLRPTLPLPAPIHFVAALQMCDDWDHVALLADYGREYVAFYWMTTA